MTSDRAVDLETGMHNHDLPGELPAASRSIHARCLTRAIVGLVAWVGVSIAGYFVVMQHEYQPGFMGRRLAHWPADSKVDRSAGMTVIAFVHPRCPCTTATITELNQAMRQANGAKLTAVVFVPCGRESDSDWTEGQHIRTIRDDIAGARIYLDSDGEDARRFGAATSGTILVYDQSGNEVFRGGITAGRGVSGDNPGRRRLDEILRGDAIEESKMSTPVFGCSLESCSRNISAVQQGVAP